MIKINISSLSETDAQVELNYENFSEVTGMLTKAFASRTFTVVYSHTVISQDFHQPAVSVYTGITVDAAGSQVADDTASFHFLEGSGGFRYSIRGNLKTFVCATPEVIVITSYRTGVTSVTTLIAES